MQQTHEYRPLEGPAVWIAAQMRATDRWIYQLTAADIADLEHGLDHVRQRKLGVPFGVADFPVRGMAERIAAWRREVEEGTGVMLVRGLDVDRYGLDGAKLLYWGIGAHIGDGVAQNPQADLLVDVRNAGGDYYKTPTLRAYRTQQRLPFHNDQADVVALLCRRTAKAGGLSCITSSAALHNEILATRPDLLAVLYQPFYADVRGEEPPGRKGFYAEPRFAMFDGKFYGQHGPFYVRSAQRFPEVPRLTAAQIEAMDLIDKLADSDTFRLDMDFRPGDMQFLNNHVTLHSRTHYEDFEGPDRARHLLRLWLRTPRYRKAPPFFVQRNEDMDYWLAHPAPAQASAAQ